MERQSCAVATRTEEGEILITEQDHENHAHTGTAEQPAESGSELAPADEDEVKTDG